MTQRGRFISIDGPSGVGKSTAIKALHTELACRGIAVHQTAEPTSSDLGRFIRSHFSHIRGHALACLVAADRFAHVDHEIEPRLAAGDTVITDRYVASSLVMQRLDGVPLPYLLALAGPVLMPDLAVILTAAPGLIADRIAARGPSNRFHRDPTAPGREVRLYEQAARALRSAGVPVLVVDTGTATPSEVAATISGAIPDPATTSPLSKPTIS
ncbi:dTMP kinase [Streptomyces sp. NPDC052042]|uniref:dTMP kinase n=1 Tax=Streptomyces sp. NPDC052042 TaxID=3365683 RepID=UPI0037CDE9A4